MRMYKHNIIKTIYIKKSTIDKRINGTYTSITTWVLFPGGGEIQLSSASFEFNLTKL